MSVGLQSKHQHLKRLREIREELRKLGHNGAADRIKDDIDKLGLNRPVQGEQLFLDKEAQEPVRVVYVQNDVAYYIPEGVQMQSTHQGNLYNEDGERPYQV